MNRRTGLGRGLAALIPPQTDDQEHTEDHPRDAERDIAPAAYAPDPPAVRTHPLDDRATGPEHPGTAEAAVQGASTAGGEEQLQTVAAQYLELPIEAITANPRQPREIFDPEDLEGLATSLQDVGMLQPLVVRPSGDATYELVAGERRLRAAKVAGLTTVPAVVRHTEDTDLLKEALVENIHRVQLNPLEEAAAYQQLLEEFGVTQDELAGQLGKSRSAITNTIRLLRLPSAVQRRVAAGVLSAGHARALLALDDPQVQQRVAERIVAEGLSVRDVEELVRLRLTDEVPTATRGRRAAGQLPGLIELQQDLSDALQTRVKVSMGAKRGRIAIEFRSVEDLERLVAVIASGLGVDPVDVESAGGLSGDGHAAARTD